MNRVHDDFEEYPADAAWLQQPGETSRAYAAFCVYRDYGPRRSLRQACQDFFNLPDKPPAVRSNRSPKLRQIEVWSSAWDWSDRAWAYTAHLDRLVRVESLERTKAMYRAQAALAALAVAKSVERIEAIDPSKLTVTEALKMFEVGVKIERAARLSLLAMCETVDPVGSVDRKIDQIIMGNPALALAASSLSMALSAAENAAADQSSSQSLWSAPEGHRRRS